MRSYGDIFLNDKRGECIAVEVKAEEIEKYGNFFLEEWSNLSRKTPGWMRTLNTDLLLYHFLDDGTDDHYGLLYCIPFQSLKTWAFETQGRERIGRIYDYYPLRRQRKYKQLNDTWGFPVNIREMTAEVRCTCYERIGGEWIRNLGHDERNAALAAGALVPQPILKDVPRLPRTLFQ